MYPIVIFDALRVKIRDADSREGRALDALDEIRGNR
jgi:transposase-like protein